MACEIQDLPKNVRRIVKIVHSDTIIKRKKTKSKTFVTFRIHNFMLSLTSN